MGETMKKLCMAFAAAGIVAVIPNLIFLALFFRDGEFKNVVNRGISILKSVVRKNEKS